MATVVHVRPAQCAQCGDTHIKAIAVGPPVATVRMPEAGGGGAARLRLIKTERDSR